MSERDKLVEIMACASVLHRWRRAQEMLAGNSPQNAADSPHNEPDSPQTDGNSPQNSPTGNGFEGPHDTETMRAALDAAEREGWRFVPPDDGR